MGFVLLVPAVPASAQEIFTFEGAGWGHAVGMSQYGARAMAEAGQTAQQIVTYYSRSREHPAGIDLDDPLPLPAGIRELQVEAGRAVIVQ